MTGRKKWKFDLFSADLVALALLWCLFFFGSVAGCIAVGFMDTSGRNDLTEYAQGYVALLSEGSFRPQLWLLVLDVLQYPLMVVLVGFTALGVILIPLLFLVRGFLFCFAISAFYCIFGPDGQLFAALLFGLSGVIWFPTLFHLGVQGILASYSLLRRAIGEGRYPLRYNQQYFARCGLCAAALGVCVAVEYLIVPTLLQVLAGAA